MRQGICIWTGVTASVATSTLGCFIIKWMEWGEACEGSTILSTLLFLYIMGVMGLSWLVFYGVCFWLMDRVGW